MNTHISLPPSFNVNVDKDSHIGKSKPFFDRFTGLKQRSKTIEEQFQCQFIELEEYLARLLEEQNYEYSPGIGKEEKISMAKAKAKEYFKNCAFETFRHIKDAFENEQFHHILPGNFVTKVIENIKQNLDESLHQLTSQILESVSENDKPQLDQNSCKIQKKLKKGKTKIPKRALTVLKNWLTEHFQDPYPSHSEKMRLAKEADISFKQVQNWFTNARGRIWRRTYNPDKFVSQIEEKLVEKGKPKPVIVQSECWQYGEQALPKQAPQAGMMYVPQFM